MAPSRILYDKYFSQRLLLGAKWKRIFKFTYPINFVQGCNQPDETLNFLIRKWKPCFSRICQKVKDWLRLFSRLFLKSTQIYNAEFAKWTCWRRDSCFGRHRIRIKVWLTDQWMDKAAIRNNREKSRSQSSTFWHIRNIKLLDLLPFSFQLDLLI